MLRTVIRREEEGEGMGGDIPKFSLLKFRTLIRDTRGPADGVNEVLHTQEELDEYLASCQGNQKPKHPVGFPEEKAVAVALGSRPHGGYGVEIIAVVQETGGFVGVQHHVLYTEQVPHGLATDMVTFPQHVIRVRGLSGIVSFRQVPDSIGHTLSARAMAAGTATSRRSQWARRAHRRRRSRWARKALRRRRWPPARRCT
jgi:hypothetical protein